VKDFTYIANMCSFPLLLVSHPSLPVKNVKELIALAKARPNEIVYSSPGVGNTGHLAAALFESYAWGGMIGPANMPRDVVNRLNQAIVDTLKQKDVIDRMLSEGTVPTPSSPDEFLSYMKSELKKWGDVVKMAGIKPE